MSVDNTHTKYLHGSDKKVWNNYKDAYESQQKLDDFQDKLMAGFGNRVLFEGEEYDIPVRKK